MSSQGSVSTAQAAGSGLPQATAGNKNSNKMKLEMPPRPARTNSRRQPSGVVVIGGASGGGSGDIVAAGAVASPPAGTEGGWTDETSVPHVVRVTFLGVAGLLAKRYAASSGNTAGKNALEGPPTATASPASGHPSLLLPLPQHMQVVASVSRSRTARGIPSGMSKCLSSPSNSGNSRDQQKKPKPPSVVTTPSSIVAMAGSFAVSPIAGESIVVEKQSSDRAKPTTDEISAARDQPVAAMDDFGGVHQSSSARKMKGYRSARNAGSHLPLASSQSFDDVAPPSQLMNSRTSSARGAKYGRGGRSCGGERDSGNPGSKSSSLEPEQTEGIEVIRPYSPTEASKNNFKAEGAVAVDTDANEPERLVAVWDEGVKAKQQRTHQTSRATLYSGGAQQQQQQQHFVNTTNSLAFEADLRPSSSLVSTAAGEGRSATPSTTFAPKSFCVTVGLVPDYEPPPEWESTPVLDEIGEAAQLSNSATSIPSGPPSFAIPVGFADLVINGDETLDGKRKQIDLPLSSIGSFIDMFGGAGEKTAQPKTGGWPFPLIELTAEGLAGAVASASSNNSAKEAVEDIVAARFAATATGKVKKKSIVKRMFSRKQNNSSSAAASASAASSSAGVSSAAVSSPASPPPIRVYSGKTPRSIFQLGRPPNSKERTLFLERYGIDPSGDAVIRIGLEVFPRGSELEKIFRQKNKLRKKAAAEAARAAAVGSVVRGRKSPVLSSSGTAAVRTRSQNGRLSPGSVGSRTNDTADSRSLMDDDEDDYEGLDSDCEDSVFSQSFFTLDSDASRTTWDESTMYTDALSSFNTVEEDDDDSMSYTTGFNDDEKFYRSKGSARRGVGGAAGKLNTMNLFAGLLNCNGPTSMTCGVDEETEMDCTTPFPSTNIDAVASAVASMSMVESGEEDYSTPRTGKGQIKSATSADTAVWTTYRAISPESIKESGEELTLVGTMSPGSKSCVSSGGHHTPLDTCIPFEDRAVTLENETTPLATIKQRFAESQTFDEGDSRRRRVRGGGQFEEGTEFTLEEHQSSM